MCLALGCSSTAQDVAEGDPLADGADDNRDPAATGGLSGDGGGGDEGGTTGGGPFDPDGGSSSGGEPPAPGDSPLCPDRLPADWVFCEDFETLDDPAAVFFEYQDGDGNFVLVDDAGASGTHSMRATYLEGVEGAGWISVAFGDNPIIYGEKPHYASGDSFQEIYWRVRVKMEAGWPDVGPHKLTRLTAFAEQDWDQAMIAHLWSAGSDVFLVGDPASCVTGATVNCQGYNDFDSLEWLGQLVGSQPLFSNAYSGRWHCVEGHVTLNTPGAADGTFEFWVDDEYEDGREDLDWRGSWELYGLNLVSIENFWNGGAPMALNRWIDDLVISTSPIGCD